MKKLIVNIGHNAPMSKIAALLVIWEEVAELLDKVASLPYCYYLVWELDIQQCCGNARRLGNWEAYCSVKMVFQAKIGEIGDQTQYAEVPVTDVHQIMLYEDNGTFCWHSDPKKPADDLKTIGLIAKAVVKGSLPGGYHYEYNWIPTLKVSK